MGRNSVWEDEKVLCVDGGAGRTTMWIYQYLMSLNCALIKGKFYVIYILQ